MKKVILLAIVFFVGLSWFNAPYSHSDSDQPPKARTGAPNESTCAISGCHVGTINSGAGSVQMSFNNGATTYTPGQTYPVSVTVASPGAQRWGFEAVALNSSNQSVGSFIGSSANHTGVGSSGGRQYVYHVDAPIQPNSYTFNFQWTAPTPNAGNVTFYIIGNAANNNDQATSDLIYTSTRVVSGVNVGLEQNRSWLEMTTYPNPATNQVKVQYQLPSSQHLTFRVLNMAGAVVGQATTVFQQAGNNTYNIDLDESDFANGLYWLQMTNEKGETSVQKFVVNH